MTKFTIGSQWKTREGTRAIVIDKKGNDKEIGVYYYSERCVFWIRPDGTFMNGEKHIRGLDIIEPWVEPKEYDVWVNVYRCEKDWICFGEDSDGYPMATKENADAAAKPGRLACVNVKFKEGDGL